jgi:hypothetical protein
MSNFPVENLVCFTLANFARINDPRMCTIYTSWQAMESTWPHTYWPLEVRAHVLMVARLNPSVHFRALARINNEWTDTATFYVHGKRKDLGSRASFNFIIRFKILRWSVSIAGHMAQSLPSHISDSQQILGHEHWSGCDEPACSQLRRSARCRITFHCQNFKGNIVILISGRKECIVFLHTQ